MKRQVPLAILLAFLLPIAATAAQLGDSMTSGPNQSVSEPQRVQARPESEEPQKIKTIEGGPNRPYGRPTDAAPKKWSDGGPKFPIMSSLAVNNDVQAMESGKKWTTQMTINKPRALDFSWTANKATKGRWRVTDSGGKELAAGETTNAEFTINFASFIPPYPPASPAKYEYRVTAWAVLPDKGNPSAPVIITYADAEKSEFVMGCTTSKDCVGGKCVNNQCVAMEHWCEMEDVSTPSEKRELHYGMSNDGSKIQCGKYKCASGHCLKSCGSVNDCAPPSVCVSSQCVPRSTY